MSIGTKAHKPDQPLTVFNELMQLRHLHLTLKHSDGRLFEGDLHLPNLKTLKIGGNDDFAVSLPKATWRHMPATCLQVDVQLFIVHCQHDSDSFDSGPVSSSD